MITKSKLKEICDEGYARIGFVIGNNNQVVYCAKEGSCDNQGLAVKVTDYQRREPDKLYQAKTMPICELGIKNYIKLISNWGERGLKK